MAPCHIEQLKARAHTVSGTLTGVARELILTGLAGGDNKALAERLVQIERRRTVLEGLAREVSETAQHVDAVSAHRAAVAGAARHLERTAAWARRGKTHELVHLALHLILGARDPRLPLHWHEFVAYAVQFELMSSPLREAILTTHANVKAFGNLSHVHEFTYGGAPEAFAISSYKT